MFNLVQFYVLGTLQSGRKIGATLVSPTFRIRLRDFSPLIWFCPLQADFQSDFRFFYSQLIFQWLNRPAAWRSATNNWLEIYKINSSFRFLCFWSDLKWIHRFLLRCRNSRNRCEWYGLIECLSTNWRLINKSRPNRNNLIETPWNFWLLFNEY